MKWSSFFIAVLFISCNAGKEKTVSATQEINGIPSDTIMPQAVDTGINSKRNKEKDSLLSIKPLLAESLNNRTTLLFNNTDTSLVRKEPIQFIAQQSQVLDKDSMPLQDIMDGVAGRYKIRFKTIHKEYDLLNSIAVNGRPLLFNKNIDASLVKGFDMENLEFYSDAIYLYNIHKQEYLLFRGGIQKCTGNACGCSFYILYSPLHNKGFAWHQFRSNSITIGYAQKKQSIEFWREEIEHNDYLDVVTMNAEKYLYSGAGKVIPFLNKERKQTVLEGYINNDSVYILETAR